MTESKLDTGLETTSADKPKELKFTDYSIDNYESDFTQKTKKGVIKKTIKTNKK